MSDDQYLYYLLAHGLGAATLILVGAVALLADAWRRQRRARRVAEDQARDAREATHWIRNAAMFGWSW